MVVKNRICIDFGRVVRRIRTSLGISQEDLGDRASIHRTYIGGIERGERNPTLTMIHRLAEALKVHPLKFFDTEDDRSTNENR